MGIRRHLVIVAVALAAAGCGDGDGGGSTAPVLPEVCADALRDAPASGLRSAGTTAGAEPTPAIVGLSSCEKGEGGTVAIGGAGGCGPNVVVDQDFTGARALGRITIHDGGKLVFPDLGHEATSPKRLNLTTAGISIESGGLFGIGTAACPMGYHPDTHAQVTFTGDRDASCDRAKGCDDGAVKGIEVRPGGILRLYGSKGVPNPDPEAGAPGVSWTVLRETAPAAAEGGATLHLAADVTKGQRPWEDGDWIVVATSSFSPFESEFVQIVGEPTADPDGGSTVKTRQALRFSHFGSKPPTPSQRCAVNGKTQPVACGSVAGCTAPCLSEPSPLNYNDPAEQNFGVDERAEVGLISRSITLTAVTPAAPAPDCGAAADPGLHWGGEIRIAGGNGTPPPDVAIVGVELEKFGKDQLGSYPIHLHMIGDAQHAVKIRANSIHHSFNKCITMHMTSNLDVEDNVCARIVGHIFYEEHGAEENISFRNNLGIGAMSNSFDIYKVTTVPPEVKERPRSELIRAYWWTGDNLAKTDGYHYDGFNIPNTDNQQNPTHGSCKRVDGNGGFGRVREPYVHDPERPDDPPRACDPDEYYTEPASGFWITNPTTELIGNAIAGCQGVGRGFWWVPPKIPLLINGRMQDLKYTPLGIPGHPHAFLNNRAHGCYAGYYGEPDHGVISEQLFSHKDGTSTGQPVIAQLDGMTATRNRFRGVWLRPTWFVLKDGRFATNRESVTLVTSGGLDGNAPGVWLLLKDSVLVGVSPNNVDRFGQCPRSNVNGIFTGGQFGCVDHTPPPVGVPAHSGDELGEGYPTPSWNMFGYMLYDGPVRVFDDRFVNFRKDPSSLLTAADNAFLTTYASQNTPTAQSCVAGPKTNQHCNVGLDCYPNQAACDADPNCPTACPLPKVLCADGDSPNCCANAAACNTHFIYEGDAAFGWFQSNQSAYPTGTAVRGLSWVNTDLRHQIYTEKVSLNLLFNDGDKNTAIIDEDGTLTGFAVRSADGTSVHPISLNNLPFNATSNSVDECLSAGAQNQHFEGRDTSLISPNSLGTLEFSTLFPWKDSVDGVPVAFPGPVADQTHTQFLTFTRDDPEVDAAGNPRRDKQGNILHASMTLKGRDGRGVWEPKVTSGYGYTVAASPAPDFPRSTGKAGIAHIMTVGLVDVVKPNVSADNPFYVRLGICYAKADGSHPQDPTKFRIRRGYKSFLGGLVEPTDPELLKYWSPSECNNLDSLHPVNITGPTCPGPRPRTVAKAGGSCPAGSMPGLDDTTCVFPTDDLERVDDPAAMLNPQGKPNLRTYSYDKTTGMLFLWVAQDEPNPLAPSPLGSCTGNPATDDPSCPDFAHGESYYACPKNGCHLYLISLDDPSYTPGASTCQPYETYTHAPFAPQHELVLHGTDTAIERQLGFDKAGDPFHTASAATDPQCKLTVSAPAPAATAASAITDADASQRAGVDPVSPPSGAGSTPAVDRGSPDGAPEDAVAAPVGSTPTPFVVVPDTPTATPEPAL
jgi:hypothetical protein